MNLLELQEVTVEKDGRLILDALTLALAAGEIHALLGTNGTGKSTLAYLIMGCGGCRPSRGEILFAGKSLLPLNLTQRAQRGISLAWQEPVRFEGLSVARYLALGKQRRTAAEALSMVGLAPELYLSRMVDSSLSGGERKRIELASLLTLPLRLAILDEPDSGIDMLSTQGIIDVIHAFRAEGTSVLLVTHRQEIARVADRASQLCGGKIIRSGEPEDVANHYLKRKCLLCNGKEDRDADT